MDILPILFFIVFFGFILFMLFSKKGKEIFFGGKIVKTMDAVTKGKKRMLMSSDIKIHVIKSSWDKKNIGLEINLSGGLSYSMVPLVLPIGEAKILADTIYAAIEFTEHQTDMVNK